MGGQWAGQLTGPRVPQLEWLCLCNPAVQQQQAAPLGLKGLEPLTSWPQYAPLQDSKSC